MQTQRGRERDRKTITHRHALVDTSQKDFMRPWLALILSGCRRSCSAPSRAETGNKVHPSHRPCAVHIQTLLDQQGCQASMHRAAYILVQRECVSFRFVSVCKPPASDCPWHGSAVEVSQGVVVSSGCGSQCIASQLFVIGTCRPAG